MTAPTVRLGYEIEMGVKNMKSDITRAMRQEIKDEHKILRVKERIITILERLPDDASRARVVFAAQILLGMKVHIVVR